MFSYKIYCREDRDNDIRVRVIQNRRKSEFSIGLSLGVESLENALSGKPKLENVRFARHLTYLKDIIDKFKMELVTTGRSESISATEIRDTIRSRFFNLEYNEEEHTDIRPSFVEFYEKVMAKKSNSSYRASFDYTLDKITEFASRIGSNSPKLTFEDINLKWLFEFDEFLIRLGASQNTRNIHFKNIRTVFNRAIDEELTQGYPFRRFKIKPESTRKRSLTIDELRKLFTCEVEPYQEFYRDMFKLIFMLCGINAVDLHGLTEITKDGRIEYRRAKTKKLYSIKVEPEAMEIIEKHRGRSGLTTATDRWADHRDFNKNTNLALKKIGILKRVGRGGRKKITPFFPDISTYWARHTWSTIAYHLDVPKDIISQALGHSSGSDVTEIYIDRDQAKVDRANRLVLDYVLYGREVHW